MLLYMSVAHPFLFPSGITSYRYPTVGLSIHLVMGNLGCFQFLAITSQAAMNIRI